MGIEELECINPGEIKMIGRKYVVQIKGDESLKYESELPSYLREVYDLSLSEYCSFVLFGNKDSKQKCLWCGKPTELRYKLYKGFKTYCNISCKNSHRNTENNPSKSEEVKRKISEFQSKRLRELATEGLNAFQKPHTNFNSLNSRYKTLGVENTYLYLIYWGESSIKIGVTCNLNKREYDLRYIGAKGAIHPVLYGKAEEMLKLEMKIKNNYCKDHSELFKFEDLRKVLSELK